MIGQLGDVDVSVTFSLTGACMLGGVVVWVNPALGGPQVGAGVGEGVGVGDAEELGEGVGVGVGVGVAPTPVGRASSWVVDVEENVTVWPPRSGAMNGIRSVSWPLTVTLTRWPRVLEQSGVQTSEMSDGWIVTTEFFASSRTRHTTWFVVAPRGQAWFALYEDGVWAA